MTEKEYSDDQVVHVQRIKQCKDYYEVLQVSKDASEEDLKRNYRKLALKLHPDKNKAPGAAEAFKAVGNAFAVLNDKEKRRQYDLYGPEDATARSASTSHRHAYYQSDEGYYYDYSRGFEGDVSPEDLFNLFFGTGFTNGNIFVRRNTTRRPRQQAPPENHSARSLLLQLVPLFILLGVSMISHLMVSEPPYNLVRTSKYMYERHTEKLNIPYYVKESFISENQDSLRRIEREIEQEYIITLRQSCYREKNYRESMLHRARYFRDEEMEQNAREIRMPACSKLNDLNQKINIYV